MKAMMQHTILSAALLLAAVTMPAHAEKADSTKPIEVTFGQLDADDVKQIKTFTGNVVFTRGTIRMTSPKAVVTQDPEGYQFVVLTGGPGVQATFRQRLDGDGDQWVEGQADRIEYDDKTELVKLFAKGRIKRLEGSKVTSQVDGEFISYDSRREVFAVKNTPTGDSKVGGGQSTMVIQPSPKRPPIAPAQPAGK
ncbi:MAG: lipopolysaccharide transport periplasmic protein LptA [Duganella sp.]